jgi:hypothetical protein
MEQMDEMCTLLMEYMLGELGGTQLEEYQKHMEKCAFCRTEYDSLWPLHESLIQDDSSQIQDSILLGQKMQILNQAFSKRRPVQLKSSDDGPLAWLFTRKPLRKRYWLMPAAAIVACLLLMGVIVRNVSTENFKEPPVSFQTKVQLNPSSMYPQAKGTALVVNHLSQTSLIVYVTKVPVQSEWGCYEVWGVKNGKKYGLGEFTVNHQGDGALTIKIGSTLPYDRLEITLEPQWGDPTPQGPQVLQGMSTNV